MDLSLCSGVLITGGAGFLGSHLCEFFIRNGIPTYAVDNFATCDSSNIDFLTALALSQKSHFEFIKADVVQAWTWNTQVQKPISHVFHFASPASPPHYKILSLETLEVNSIGLLNALNFATSRKARVVFASTSEVYGDPAVSPQPESYWGNVNSYGERSCYDEAKRYGEALIYSYNKKYKTNHGLVRIFNTYGPRMNLQDGRVVINFLVQAFNKIPLTVYGSGSQTRSFCYVSDLIDGIVRYALGSHTQPVNIGNDTEFTILELTKVVQELFKDRDIEISFNPIEPDDPQQRRPNLSLAKSVLSPWTPQVKLLQGLSKTLEWIAAKGKTTI